MSSTTSETRLMSAASKNYSATMTTNGAVTIDMGFRLEAAEEDPALGRIWRSVLDGHVL
jgi:hypothetical protein